MTTTVSKSNRFLGILIDGIVAYIPAIILGIIASATGLGFLTAIGALIALAYYLLRDALTGGQSIGKKVMKYKAVKADGSSLEGDFKTSAIRNVSLMIPLVDAIFILMDKPRLGEEWANTKVVAESK